MFAVVLIMKIWSDIMINYLNISFNSLVLALIALVFVLILLVVILIIKSNNNNSSNVNGVKWNLQRVVNRKGTINLFTDRLVSDTTNDTLTFSFTASQINSLLKNNILKENSSDSTWNVNYSGVIYRIYI